MGKKNKQGNKHRLGKGTVPESVDFDDCQAAKD